MYKFVIGSPGAEVQGQRKEDRFPREASKWIPG